MNVLAVIPARGGSKRIPRKNLLKLDGKPLIGYSIAHAKRSKLVNRIVVSTEDEEIAYISKLEGAEVVWRPRELAGDAASSESALIHVVDYLEEHEKYLPDLLVFLQ
jgi:CMP-N-acetylneuraminic acid synthetase